MSTILRIAIKHQNLEDIRSALQDVYLIGRTVLGFIDERKFSTLNAPNRTFILHQKLSAEWVQIDLRLYTLYELDETLRQLTLKYRTTAFVAYSQTTSCSSRFAFFEDGELRRSINQEYIEGHKQVRLVDNFGSRLPFEKLDLAPYAGRELPVDHRLDYEDFNEWYKALGFIWDGREEVDYLHLEVLGFKN